MNPQNQGVIREKLNYLDTLKFTKPANTKKRKENPIQIKYEEPNGTNTKFDRNNKRNFEYIWNKILEMREKRDATVDLVGCHVAPDKNAPKEIQDFQLLIALIISVQNREESTYAAVQRLKQHGLNAQNIYNTDEGKILDIIGGVNFNKTKAKNIKNVTTLIVEKYDGIVPNRWDVLLTFPGVGNKIAVLYLNFGHGLEVGIGVDTHVHRISNRLGLVHTKLPDQTRVELESFVPKKYWSDYNVLFVGFGQQICLPINPKCQKCLLNNICPEGKKKLEGVNENIEIKSLKKHKKNQDPINEKEASNEKIEINLKKEETDGSKENSMVVEYLLKKASQKVETARKLEI